jgi:hypothetical protein
VLPPLSFFNTDVSSVTTTPDDAPTAASAIADDADKSVSEFESSSSSMWGGQSIWGQSHADALDFQTFGSSSDTSFSSNSNTHNLTADAPMVWLPWDSNNQRGQSSGWKEGYWQTETNQWRGAMVDPLPMGEQTYLTDPMDIYGGGFDYAHSTGYETHLNHEQNAGPPNLHPGDVTVLGPDAHDITMRAPDNTDADAEGELEDDGGDVLVGLY